MSERMCQCRLEQESPDGLITLVAFIEERGAKVGNRVELKGEDGFWLVKSVSEPVLSEYVKEKQRKDRGSLLSIVK